MVHSAGVGAPVLLLAVAAFQDALALGAPLGDATMGERARTKDGVLAPPFRIAAAGIGFLLLLAAWITAVRAGVLGDGPVAAPFRWGTWAVVAFMAINTVGNLAGRHPLERWVMGPATITVAALSVIVALG